MAALRDDTPYERALKTWRTNTDPRPSTRARKLIREAASLHETLEEASRELAAATAAEDTELTIRASRRVYSVAALLYLNADKLVKGPRLL